MMHSRCLGVGSDGELCVTRYTADVLVKLYVLDQFYDTLALGMRMRAPQYKC